MNTICLFITCNFHGLSAPRQHRLPESLVTFSPMGPKCQDECLTHNRCLVCMYVLSCFSCVRLFETLWTAIHQHPLSMGFSRQIYVCTNIHTYVCEKKYIYTHKHIFFSRSVVSDPCVTPTTIAYHAPRPRDFFGKNTREGCHFFLRGGCSQPREGTHVSCLTDRFFTAESPGKPTYSHISRKKSRSC